MNSERQIASMAYSGQWRVPGSMSTVRCRAAAAVSIEQEPGHLKLFRGSDIQATEV
jgi:hypothetical protein